jgi:DNA mismatch repair ATPase MutS
MAETSTIVHNASRRSLVVLDELGRGTSTYDGVAIAYAVVEYIRSQTRLRCLTLFSTHYHVLLQLYENKPAEVDRFHMQSVETQHSNSSHGQRVDFVYLYTRGISPKSYGMNVALMAGLPPEVVEKATRISEQFDLDCTLGREAAAKDVITQKTKKQLTREEVDKVKRLLAKLRLRQ